MKRYIWLALLTVVVGCMTTKSIPPVNPKPQVDTKAQDVAFEMALKEVVTNSHNAEMTAIAAQTEILTRIEESVASLKASSTLTEPLKPENGTETLIPEENGPNDALEPQENDSEPPEPTQEDSTKPILYVTYANFNCPPCEVLKKAVEEGKLEKFNVIESTDVEGLRTNRPVIRFEWPSSPSGYGIIYGYDTDIHDWLINNLPAAPMKAQAYRDTVISIGKSSIIVPTITKSITRSVTRGSGPRWNWNGSWNVSNWFAENHLRQAHGIEASGLSMSEMEALHDNAHNGVVQASRYSAPPMTYTQQTMRYSSPVRNQSVFRYRSRRSCPGGNCP